jgi:hypothetical protein
MKVNQITEAVIDAAIEVLAASGQGCWIGASLLTVTFAPSFPIGR